MNSLPRWFGRKKSSSREERKSPIKISEPFAPVHCSGMSSVSSVSQSLASLNSVSSEAEENLYVNGQVPRGQFKEYFMPPDNQSEHKFAVPNPPRLTGSRKPRVHVSRAESIHVSNSKPVLPTVKRSASIRSNIVINSSFLGNKTKLFVRQGSGRNSLLKKSLSVDDVLEESLNESRESEQNINNYYNVQYLGKNTTSSTLILNRENLQQHDQIYMEKLRLELNQDTVQVKSGVPGPDPLSTSYLGHTLLSQVNSEKDNSEDDRDSGAVSMGGGIIISSVSRPLLPQHFQL